LLQAVTVEIDRRRQGTSRRDFGRDALESADPKRLDRQPVMPRAAGSNSAWRASAAASLGLAPGAQRRGECANGTVSGIRGLDNGVLYRGQR
jgi:hypothetical protein